jgi:hypothetical protein
MNTSTSMTTAVERHPLETVRGSWADLVSAALVGTERRPFAPDPALPAAADPAQSLLQQAMLATVPALTGEQPAHYEDPPPEPMPADDRPLIARTAQLRLRSVLEVYPKYLGEWLTAVQASGCRLPQTAMPGLLEAGRNNAEIRGVLAKVLGARGHWLARYNASWRYLRHEPCGPLRAEDWDGPDPDARIAYANGLYAAEPAAARALLETAWPTLTADLKLSVLGPIARHGGKDDLPFVKGLSQDSSKRVRENAKGVESVLQRRTERSGERSPEKFTAEVERLAAAGDIGDGLYRFATRRDYDQWPLDGARVILAALYEYSRDPAPGGAGDRAAEDRRARSPWGAEQLVDMLADRAPLELRPDVERVAQAQTDDLAAGRLCHLDLRRMLAPLDFRAAMHAELTASADAAPGQE